MSQEIARALPSARRPLGRSKLNLTALGLGAAGLAGLYRDVTELDASHTIVAAWDAGIRYFDTAPFYGHGKSERRLGEGLRALRDCGETDAWVVSTKVGRVLRRAAAPLASPTADGWADPDPYEVSYNYSYDGVMRSHEDSLQRLALDKVDILLVHDIGSQTHGAENAHYWRQLESHGGFRALDELRATGQIKAIGLGVNETAVVHDALRAFDLDCCLLAGRYTLLEQAALTELFPACAARGVSLLLGGVFNSGILATGVGVAGSAPPTYNYAPAPPEVIERVRAMQALCLAYKTPLAAVALQFPYAHPQVASVLTGARSAHEVQQNIDGFRQRIDPGLWEALRHAGLLADVAPCPGEVQC